MSEVTEHRWPPDLEQLTSYHVDMDSEAFRKRYAGLPPGVTPKRLSRAAMRRIWRVFMAKHSYDFFEAHVNMQAYDVARIGIDKFIYMMAWEKVSDVPRWRNNKVRVGICCHCQDQFVLMMLQHNHGLCKNCKPLYSSKAIRGFLVNQLWSSERYEHAHRDLFMDFFVLFYHDPKLRELFHTGSESALDYEAETRELPDWFEAESGKGMVFTRSTSQVVVGGEGHGPIEETEVGRSGEGPTGESESSGS